MLHTTPTHNGDPFADMPNDLDFDPARPATVLTDATAGQRYATAPNAAAYRDPCPRCGGTGKFRTYSGRTLGDCFHCKGLGYIEHKTSPAQREQARAKAAARKEQARADIVAQHLAWCEANLEDAQWLEHKAATFDFARAMIEALAQWGALTERQHATVTRLRLADAERDAARAAAQARAAEVAPAVDAARLEAAFAHAKATGLKWPKITLAELVFKPAPATGRNAGAIYATEHGQYLGKVLGGKFLRVRECTDGQEARITQVVNDPQGTAEAHGLQTGHCCICNRELTDPVSVERGIGPICAGRFGW